MHGQPFGYILLTLIALVAGMILALGFLFLGEVLEEQESVIEFAAKVAVTLLVWAPITFPVLRSQAVFLAASGGLPATLRAPRVARIIALATIVLVVLLDLVSDGKWMTRYHESGGYLLPFWLCFPFVVWIAVRTSLGGKPIVSMEIKAPPPGPSMYTPRAASGSPMPKGAARDRVLDMLGVLDGIDAEFAGRRSRSAEEILAAVDALWVTPLPSEVPVDLQANLALAGAAYCDAVRIAGSDRETQVKIAAKYRDPGVVAAGELELVLAVARRARENSQRSVG